MFDYFWAVCIVKRSGTSHGRPCV